MDGCSGIRWLKTLTLVGCPFHGNFPTCPSFLFIRSTIHFAFPSHQKSNQNHAIMPIILLPPPPAHPRPWDTGWGPICSLRTYLRKRVHTVGRKVDYCIRYTVYAIPDYTVRIFPWKTTQRKKKRFTSEKTGNFVFVIWSHYNIWGKGTFHQRDGKKRKKEKVHFL